MAVPPAFEQVYADCGPHVHALCVNLLVNAADAQDAFQDTFLAVAQALPQFRGEASVKTWVHRIAIRTALKLRARRRPAEELGEHASSGGNDPIAEHAEADAVMRAMRGLSFEHRVVLAMFAIAGLSHGEIAQTLGIAEGTVWSRLHHAKKKLGELLKEVAVSPRIPSR
jgi:RNA polymerase sigma-70 factor (ECF subfamily)